MTDSPVLPDPGALFRRIDADYWDPKRRLYRDAWEPAQDGAGQPVFNWGLGVMLSALNTLHPKDELARQRLEEWRPAILSYWNTAGPISGFDVLPAPKPVDRYYDDNAWMVLALFDTWKLTRDREWLTYALKALAYCKSGWSSQLGGGIYWRESDKASKNTCINAPAAAACFRAYELTKDPDYKEFGFRLLDWMLPRLQDPADGLMWDHIRLDGHVDKTKWSYNTALTAKALIEAEALGRKFEPGGRELFARAWRHWFDPAAGIKDEAAFAHLLVDVGLDYDLIPEADLRALKRSLAGHHSAMRFGKRWDRKPEGARHELLAEASVLRTLARLQAKGL